MGKAARIKRSKAKELKPRECGDCQLCCKLMNVPGLKENDEWCKHCDRGVGCSIYTSPEKPQSCSDFLCLWRLDVPNFKDILPESLRPDKCGLVLASKPSPDDGWQNFYVYITADDVTKEDYATKVVHFFTHRMRLPVILRQGEHCLGFQPGSMEAETIPPNSIMRRNPLAV